MHINILIKLLVLAWEGGRMRSDDASRTCSSVQRNAVVSALTFLHPSADLPAFLIAKVYFSTNVKRLSWMQNIYITFSLVLSNWKEHSKLFTPSIVLGLWFAMFDGHRLSPTSMAGLMSSDAIIFFKIFNTNREHIVRLYSESPCNCKNNFFHFWCLFFLWWYRYQAAYPRSD